MAGLNESNWNGIGVQTDWGAHLVEGEDLNKRAASINVYERMEELSCGAPKPLRPTPVPLTASLCTKARGNESPHLV